MQENNEEKDYEVGYKRPPAEYQFQPGQSGNPKGRAKNPAKQRVIPRNFEADFRNAMDEEIEIQEKGQTRKITMQQALIRVLQAKALKGEMAALKLAMSILLKLPPTKSSFATINEALEAIRVNLIRAKEDGTIPPSLEEFHPSEFLPIPEPQPRQW